MHTRQTALSAAIMAIMGTTGIITPVSALVPDGEYDMVILTTPIKTTVYGGTAFRIGKDGAYNSSFTFGALPGVASNGMTDTAATVNGNGSGIAGDGWAGILRIDITDTAFTVPSFNKDTIFATAGGDFAQYLIPFDNVGQMSGTIDQVTGAMTYDPTQRLGAINAPVFNDNPWNIDDVDDPGNTTWGLLRSDSITNNNGTINGAALTNIGDTNGDGTDDFEAVLVSGASVGTTWGNFATAQYFETWRIDLLARAIDDNAAVTINTSIEISVLANDGLGGGGATPLTVANATNGSLGTTTVTGGGTTVTYTAAGAGGQDSFNYTYQDNNGVQSTATVNITVTTSPVAAGNDGPFDSNQAATLSVAVSDLTANDSSSAGNIVDSTLAPSTPSAQGGTVVVNGVNIDYTPPAVDFVGADSFTYTVQDDATPANTSDPATVAINVTAYGLTDAGTYLPGPLATSEGSTDGRISGTALPPDPTMESTCVGGCYDYVITGAANSTQVSTPELSLGIAEGLIMRKVVAGNWQDYDTSTTGDAVASAPVSANGGCPAPADASWVPFDAATATSANTGHTCLRYTIADGGPNDSDSTPGIIADPSGLSAPIVQSTKSDLLRGFENDDDISGGGCSLSTSGGSLESRADWLLLGGFIGFLGWLRRRRFPH